jgi:hypothetical protein
MARSVPCHHRHGRDFGQNVGRVDFLEVGFRGAVGKVVPCSATSCEGHTGCCAVRRVKPRPAFGPHRKCVVAEGIGELTVVSRPNERKVVCCAASNPAGHRGIDSAGRVLFAATHWLLELQPERINRIRYRACSVETSTPIPKQKNYEGAISKRGAVIDQFGAPLELFGKHASSMG